ANGFRHAVNAEHRPNLVIAGAACPQSQRASARPWVNLCGISAYHLRCRPGVDCEPPGNAVDPLRLKRLTGAAARRPRPRNVRDRERAKPRPRRTEQVAVNEV